VRLSKHKLSSGTFLKIGGCHILHGYSGTSKRYNTVPIFGDDGRLCVTVVCVGFLSYDVYVRFPISAKHAHVGSWI
jgi:hypothetical protein